MRLTVQQASGHLDRWHAIAGETRWADCGHDDSGGDFVVHVHTSRRIRERHDVTRDVLLWKPASPPWPAGEWERS